MNAFFSSATRCTLRKPFFIVWSTTTPFEVNFLCNGAMYVTCSKHVFCWEYNYIHIAIVVLIMDWVGGYVNVDLFNPNEVGFWKVSCASNWYVRAELEKLIKFLDSRVALILLNNHNWIHHNFPSLNRNMQTLPPYRSLRSIQFSLFLTYILHRMFARQKV